MRIVDIIKDDECINSYDFIKEFKKSKYYDRLLEAYKNLNTDILFKSKIHGQGHIERVLFFVSLLAFKYNLNDIDTDILINAASLHDTRRINDGWDSEHGLRAATDSIKYAQNIDKDDMPILKAIMTAHARNDEEMIDIIRGYGVSDIDRALFLAKIFKDSDGLDRVRINHLDPKFLRNDFSKELVDFSYKLYSIY